MKCRIKSADLYDKLESYTEVYPELEYYNFRIEKVIYTFENVVREKEVAYIDIYNLEELHKITKAIGRPLVIKPDYFNNRLEITIYDYYLK